MKIVIASNGKKTAKISKVEWTQIGKKAGWMRQAIGENPPQQGMGNGEIQQYDFMGRMKQIIERIPGDAAVQNASQKMNGTQLANYILGAWNKNIQLEMRNQSSVNPNIDVRKQYSDELKNLANNQTQVYVKYLNSLGKDTQYVKDFMSAMSSFSGM